MSLTLAIIAFVLVLAVLVAVHEAGHMIAAKALGVRVERFSINFGPTIWERKIGDTIYQIATIPLGGYVKIKGMMPDEPETPDSFKAQPWWSKLIIVSMGPIFNFLLAAVLIFGVGFIGVPQYAAFIGNSQPGSPAAGAGIDRGDLITEVNGETFVTMKQLTEAVNRSGRTGEPLTLKVLEGPDSRTVSLVPEYNEEEDSYLMGISLSQTPIQEPKIVQLFPGQWADKAGLEFGDEFVSIDGEQINWGHEVNLALIAPPEDQIEQESGEPSELSVLPEYMQGINDTSGETEKPDYPGNAELLIRRKGELVRMNVERIAWDDRRTKGFSQQTVLVKMPLMETARFSWMRVVGFFDRIVKGLALLGDSLVEEGVKSGIVGPVGIFSVVGQAASTGIYTLTIITVIISINLGLINLFPIPALDGGRIVIILIDAVIGLVGWEISEQVENLVHTIGFVLVLLMMALIIWVDVARLVNSP